MNDNPYQPPATAIERDAITPLWKIFARFAVFVYGCAYAGLIIYGNIPESYDWDWVEVTKVIVVGFVDVLSCYGIFALVFHGMRLASLYPVWSVFAWLLPPITLADAIYELFGDATDPDEVLVYLMVALPIVLLVSTPACICNFFLVSRLKAMWNSARGNIAS